MSKKEKKGQRYNRVSDVERLIMKGNTVNNEFQIWTSVGGL